MNKLFHGGLALLLCGCAATLPSRVEYPAAPPGTVVDDYFGTRVADPYRWLEELDSAETKAWVRAQQELSQPFLAALPARDEIEERLTALWNFERYSLPFKHRGGLVTYRRNSGLQNQSVLYAQQGLAGEPRALIDPNEWSDDGTVALAGFAVSHDDRWAAYARQSAGSDWAEILVRDIATGADRADRLVRVKFSGISWTADNAGFFYSRYPDAPATGPDVFGGLAHQKLYYHRLGTNQQDDVLIYERPDQPQWFIGGEVSYDGRYLIVSVARGAADDNLLYVKDLGDPLEPRLDAPLRKVVGEFNGKHQFIGNDGPVLYLQTSRGAPRYRVVAVDLKRPAAPWRTLVAESPDVMEGVVHVGGELVALYLRDASSRVLRYSTRGRALGEIELPGIGSVAGLTGRPDDPELFYGFTSFNRPYTAFRVDLASGRNELFREPALKFRPDDYVTERVFYRSKDGTRVPMFLSYRKGLRRDGSTPTLLYGYGGFEASMSPYFAVPNLAWMERGGIYAVACLRGGGEYGEAWHEAGTKERKQNVFDDFIAAAEYLIGERYTAPAHLAINGGSNGGLLVGAVTNQRPDLFAAAVPDVGVMDMLRFHKFTVGYAWARDYGTADDRRGFRYLSAYSPYHNVKAGTRYPAVLVTTADHDDRVHPAHSFKYAAAMQAAQAADHPVLIRIETRAGHGGGKPLGKIIAEYADKLAFIGYFTTPRVD